MLLFSFPLYTLTLYCLCYKFVLLLSFLLKIRIPLSQDCSVNCHLSTVLYLECRQCFSFFLFFLAMYLYLKYLYFVSVMFQERESNELCIQAVIFTWSQEKIIDLNFKMYSFRNCKL